MNWECVYNKYMKISKAFEIEKQYQKHRQRLFSIKSLDAKKHVSISTHKTIDRINNYKKVKSNSYILKDYQHQWDIKHRNEMIHRNLTKVYSRDPTVLIMKDFEDQESRMVDRTTSQSSMRSLEENKIRRENTKMNKKLVLASSIYRKFRAKTHQHHTPKEHDHRQELIKVLEAQLGFKPKVLFPPLKPKQATNRKLPSSSQK